MLTGLAAEQSAVLGVGDRVLCATWLAAERQSDCSLTDSVLPVLLTEPLNIRLRGCVLGH